MARDKGMKAESDTAQKYSGDRNSRKPHGIFFSRTSVSM
jgi:hypothetical protein